MVRLKHLKQSDFDCLEELSQLNKAVKPHEARWKPDTWPDFYIKQTIFTLKCPAVNTNLLYQGYASVSLKLTEI